ncbi:MAG: RNA 2',3'-cyclic phosphodiesterase [Caldimicrobium sp.]|jgi:2'-5' RNA ligase
MVRAFLAIDLPEDLKRELSELSKIEVSESLKLKWVEEENLHLTIHFFGNISEKLVEKILDKAKEVFKEISPFSLELTEIGYFANQGNPKVIWIGVKDTSHVLERINRALKELLKKLKIEAPREEFHPHITLLRVKKIEKKEAFQNFWEAIKTQAKAYKDLKFSVKEIILFKSELTPKGPKYSPLGKILLGAKP